MVKCDIGTQHFQGHRRLSVGVRGQIHLGHGAGAKLALNDVAAARNRITRREQHLVFRAAGWRAARGAALQLRVRAS